MAFLPPSETSAEVIPHTANGKIVVDVTVGQLYYYEKFLGQFGLVDEPVTMIVKDGLINDIKGGYMANELKNKLFALPKKCRILVELGHGLSKMTKTGLIGVDESIIDTCHFGIGDGASSGVHLDVVVSKPSICEVCDPLLPAELAKILNRYTCTKNQIGCSLASVYRYQKEDERWFLLFAYESSNGTYVLGLYRR